MRSDTLERQTHVKQAALKFMLQNQRFPNAVDISKQLQLMGVTKGAKNLNTLKNDLSVIANDFASVIAQKEQIAIDGEHYLIPDVIFEMATKFYQAVKEENQKEFNVKLETFQQEVEESQEQVTMAELRVNELQQANDYMASQVEPLKSRIQMMQQQFTPLRDQVDSLQEQIREKDKTIEELRQVNHKLEKQLNVQTNKVSDESSDQEIAQLKQQLADKEKELALQQHFTYKDELFEQLSEMKEIMINQTVKQKVKQKRESIKK